MTGPRSEAEVRDALRAWVRARNPGLAPHDLDDQTPLIETRYLTSLQILDLLGFVERLRRRAIDPATLRPGAFRDIDAIYHAFFDATRRAGSGAR